MKTINHTRQSIQEEEKYDNTNISRVKCQICNKRPIEIYQLDYEVCCICHQMETEVRFIDQRYDKKITL